MSEQGQKLCYTDGRLKRNLKYCHIVSVAKKVSASSQNMLLHIHIKRLLSFSKILLVMKVKTILSEFLIVIYKTDSRLLLHGCVHVCCVKTNPRQCSSVTLMRPNSNTIYNFYKYIL